MARGRKSYTPAEELIIVIDKIASTEEELKALKERKKALESAVRENEIRDLYEAVKASGKTVDEVKALISAE